MGTVSLGPVNPYSGNTSIDTSTRRMSVGLPVDVVQFSPEVLERLREWHSVTIEALESAVEMQRRILNIRLNN